MTEVAEHETLTVPRRIGVIGAGGQLGQCLVSQIESAPDLALAFALTRAEHDLSDATGLRRCAFSVRPTACASIRVTAKNNLRVCNWPSKGRTE